MSNINDLTVEQLKAELKRKGCRGYSKNNKAELVKLLRKCDTSTSRRKKKTLLENPRPVRVKKSKTKLSPPAKKKSSPGKNPSALAAGAAGKKSSARALAAGAGDDEIIYYSPYPGDVFDNFDLMTEISNYLPNNDLGNTLQTHKQMRQNISNINIDKRRRLKAFAERWRNKALDKPPLRLRRILGINYDDPDYQTLIRCRRCNADIEGEIRFDDIARDYIAEKLRYNRWNGINGLAVPIFLCYRCAVDLSLQTGFIRRN
jgi:hypothetical protein